MAMLRKVEHLRDGQKRGLPWQGLPECVSAAVDGQMLLWVEASQLPFEGLRECSGVADAVARH